MKKDENNSPLRKKTVFNNTTYICLCLIAIPLANAAKCIR